MHRAPKSPSSTVRPTTLEASKPGSPQPSQNGTHLMPLHPNPRRSLRVPWKGGGKEEHGRLSSYGKQDDPRRSRTEQRWESGQIRCLSRPPHPPQQQASLSNQNGLATELTGSISFPFPTPIIKAWTRLPGLPNL